MDRFFSHIASRIANLAGQPAAFFIAIGTVFAWGLSGPLFSWSDTWQLVINTGTTIVTFLMVFLIQNAQNRDASALQVKIDELIRAIDSARNDYIGIEHLIDVEIGRLRDALERDSHIEPADRERQSALLGRLLER